MNEKFKQTISDDLFQAWNSAKRPGDATAISKVVNKSYPIVQRALKYGHVNSEKLVDSISDFFAARKENDKKRTSKIIA